MIVRGRLTTATAAVFVLSLASATASLTLPKSTGLRHAANPAAPVSDRTGGIITTAPEFLALIIEGMADSPTFAGIVADLQASNVLVTLEPDLRLRHGMSGYTAFVARTTIRRYLRVRIRPTGPECERIAVIGHELWHAREVARHPDVATQADFTKLYATRIAGRPIRGRWDSDGAVAAEQRIVHELSHGRSKHRVVGCRG